jgi:hypothetical protein
MPRDWLISLWDVGFHLDYPESFAIFVCEIRELKDGISKFFKL